MKTIVVIVRTASVERGAEALRAAVGLTLRGDRVSVATGGATAAVMADPRVVRGVETLRVLGHEVREDDGLALVATADAVEVWT